MSARNINELPLGDDWGAQSCALKQGMMRKLLTGETGWYDCEESETEIRPGAILDTS